MLGNDNKIFVTDSRCWLWTNECIQFCPQNPIHKVKLKVQYGMVGIDVGPKSVASQLNEFNSRSR